MFRNCLFRKNRKGQLTGSATRERGKEAGVEGRRGAAYLVSAFVLVIERVCRRENEESKVSVLGLRQWASYYECRAHRYS